MCLIRDENKNDLSMGWLRIMIKSKAVPLPDWSGPEDSRKLRVTDLMTTAQGGGKDVRLMHRPHLPPRISPGTHFR